MCRLFDTVFVINKLKRYMDTLFSKIVCFTINGSCRNNMLYALCYKAFGRKILRCFRRKCNPSEVYDASYTNHNNSFSR